MRREQSIEFIKALRELKNRDDRRSLAHLRRAFSETTRPAAWAVLASIGGQLDNIVDVTVAALYALHPEETGAERNIGASWRELRRKVHDGELPVNSDGGQTSFEHRFLRLLACQTKEELCHHLRPIITRAKAEERPVNYVALHHDIARWERDNVRLSWAKEYWSNSKLPTS